MEGKGGCLKFEVVLAIAIEKGYCPFGERVVLNFADLTTLSPLIVSDAGLMIRKVDELRVSCYIGMEYLMVVEEAEYIAAYDASKEVVWVKKFISGLGVVPIIEEPINMYCDNTGAIAIANESVITKGARHFRAKVHYLREVIEYGDVKLEKVHTYDNLADPFTKALAFPKHSEHTKNIGMLPASSLM
ncbi:hypothetical protein Tco_1344650 [Tanacetum coccineum]